MCPLQITLDKIVVTIIIHQYSLQQHQDFTFLSSLTMISKDIFTLLLMVSTFASGNKIPRELEVKNNRSFETKESIERAFIKKMNPRFI